jgi:hypothetical protein
MSIATPEHGTKRTIAQLASYRPDVRFIAINRKGGAYEVHSSQLGQEVELEYDSLYHAWTARFAKGVWQQISVFEPVAEEV